MNKDRKNILDNLKESGTGFNHPKGYFDDFETRLLSDLDQNARGKNHLKTEGEWVDSVEVRHLDLIGKNHGFKVPENYFEKDLDIKNKAGSTKIISLARQNAGKWISMAVAASFLLFFGLKYYTANEKQMDFTDLKNDEIENWIDEDLISFNSYEIAEAFSDVDLESKMYSDEEVTDYLDQIDIEQLILDD